MPESSEEVGSITPEQAEKVYRMWRLILSVLASGGFGPVHGPDRASAKYRNQATTMRIHLEEFRKNPNDSGVVHQLCLDYRQLHNSALLLGSALYKLIGSNVDVIMGRLLNVVSGGRVQFPYNPSSMRGYSHAEFFRFALTAPYETVMFNLNKSGGQDGG
jgi:hypothetical protein